MGITSVKYVATTKFDTLPSKDGKYDRIYYGNESCEWLIPTINELEPALDWGERFSLLTPIVTDVGIAKLEKLFDYLDSKNMNIEVIANDYGTLATLVKHKNLIPVAGRYLSKSLIDASTGALKFASPKALGFLHKHYNLKRFELTNLNKKIQSSGKINRHKKAMQGNFEDLSAEAEIVEKTKLSLYYPFQPLTLSRQCIFRFEGKTSKERIDKIKCPRKCADQILKLNYPGFVKEDLFLKGNTVFKANKKLPYKTGDLNSLGIDRLVFFPDLPM